MKTKHKIFFQNAQNMSDVKSGSAHLVVTSPPYPMISMWDEVFTRQNAKIAEALDACDGRSAFELMHRELDKVWDEMYRVLCDGGIACVNIGDAVRTVNGVFQLYNSHARILSHCLEKGFLSLPEIIWRKQTNAPNKFMGSGMLAPGAYVTLEHEFILVLRKGDKRIFETAEDKENRKESAFFWEERNNWFSDVWMDIKGTRQNAGDEKVRARSGEFPFEFAYRLVNMFTVYGDVVLDPFLGAGTTMQAAMTAGRDSLGFEIEPNFAGIINSRLKNVVETANQRIHRRLTDHLDFIRQRIETGKPPKNKNRAYGFPCVSGQETGIVFHDLKRVTQTGENEFEVEYEDKAQEDFRERSGDLSPGNVDNDKTPPGGPTALTLDFS